MVINAAVSAANSTPACPPHVTICSARVQHGLCGHWSSKQHLQCTKLHCCRRQLLRCGLRAMMALRMMMALNSMTILFQYLNIHHGHITSYTHYTHHLFAS